MSVLEDPARPANQVRDGDQTPGLSVLPERNGGPERFKIGRSQVLNNGIRPKGVDYQTAGSVVVLEHSTRQATSLNASKLVSQELLYQFANRDCRISLLRDGAASLQIIPFPQILGKRLCWNGP